MLLVSIPSEPDFEDDENNKSSDDEKDFKEEDNVEGRAGD